MKTAEPGAGLIRECIGYRVPMRITQIKLYKNGSSYYVCPRCQTTLEREFCAYCDRCGQKLSWSGYAKARACP